MKEIIIPLDHEFANAIDTNCKICLGGGGNSQQLDGLRTRQTASPYPGEREALKRYMV